MPKVLTNSRDNFLSIYSLVDRHSGYLDQPLTTTSSPTFDSLTLTGDLTVSGTVTTLDTDSVLIKDNIIELNSAETGSGVTANLSGLQIVRGSLTDYQIVFRETDDTVAIGEVGDLQALATREDSPLSDGIMIFNSSATRLDSVNDISIPITFSANEASSSSSTGSVRIEGGIGVSGSVHIDGSSYIKSGISIGNVTSFSGSEGSVNIDGDLVLYNATKNTIAFSGHGLGSPQFTTRSNGTKLLLYPGLSGSSVDYAIGVQTLGLWSSIPTSTEKFYWYSAQTEIMRLDGGGVLNTISLSLSDTTPSTSNSTGSFVSTGGVGISNTTDAASYTNGGTITTAGGAAIAKKLFVGDSSSFSKGVYVATDAYSGIDLQSYGMKIGGNTYTDSATLSSGVSSMSNLVNMKRTTLAAQNSSVTTTVASTLYIEGSPITGTNQTIQNGYSLFVDSGITRLDGLLSLTAGITSSNSSTGTLVVTGGVGISGNLNVDGASSFGETQINTSLGTLSILGSGSVSCNVNGSIDIFTTNTVSGIHIATNTTNIPITIGHSISEVTIGDNLTVVGDLLVNGITTTINSTTLNIADNAVVVNSLPSGISDGGILVRRYQTPNDSGTGGQIVSDTADETSVFGTGSSTPSTLVLHSSASGVNDYYRGWWVKITSGTGINQVRRIKSYNGTTKEATLYITIDNTSSFVDGLNLTTAPSNGDSYNLYSGTYSGSFYDDTNDEWVLGKVPYDSGAGVFPLVDYQDLHVKGLTVETVSGFVSNPVLSLSNQVNITSTNQANISIISTEPDRTLSGCLRIVPTSSLTTCSLEFGMPDVVTNWTNSYDITVVLSGYYDNSNYYSVENIVGFAVTGTTRARIKFTASSTTEHVIQFLIRYSVV
jgi:hypothetical protein